MKKIMFALALTLTSLSNARGLTSHDSLLGFKCTLTSAAGVTNLSYKKSEDGIAKGFRNSFVPVQYSVNSVGPTQAGSQISLAGGALQKNQFLSLVFTHQIPSGNSSAVGTVLLVTMGGSVFAPITLGAVPVGAVNCSSIEVK